MEAPPWWEALVRDVQVTWDGAGSRRAGSDGNLNEHHSEEHSARV